ncbi:MAG: carboxypeptidase-like regulatory domain-containing protein [Bryobacteraceae bacterium]
MRTLLLSIITTGVMGWSSISQEVVLPCAGMVYENRSQTDYGPLRLASIRGTAKDSKGVRVPGVCIGIFTPKDHNLIMATQTDREGSFEFRGVANGEYRLVAKCEGFCSGNAKIRVDPSSRSKKRLDLLIRPSGLDSCSYFELK